MGGIVSKIIAAQFTIPGKRQRDVTTFVDSQTAVDIHILQGEREMASDNRSLRPVQACAASADAAGPARIQVRFQIDANAS